MTGGPIQRWRNRVRGRTRQVMLPFDDIMEFALALLSVSPAELEALGWTFADRKRLLDHFLSSGKAAQGVSPDALPQTQIKLRLPRQDVERLQQFARRELPKAATNARMIDRVMGVLEEAKVSHPQ